jgi:hypothetical protein
MSISHSDAAKESPRFAKPGWAFAVLIMAGVLGLCGIVLLVAGKSFAGSALVVSAFSLLVPLRWLTASRRVAWSLRAAVIFVLCIVALRSISNTDIVPDQELTGWKILDQVAAILRRFRDNVIGRT